jgi:hypothetical protein
LNRSSHLPEDVHQAKTAANHDELMAAMKASHEKMEILMDVSLQMAEACPED